MSDIREKAVDEKFCSSCGAIIKKEAEICPKCGVRQIALAVPSPVSKKKYCSSCGELILKEAEICPKCGVRQLYVNPQAVVQSINNTAIPEVITTISKREKICSIFWIIVASLQALIALIKLFYVHNDVSLLFDIAVFGVISTLNFIAGFKGIKFSKEILTSDCRIMDRYIQINSYIITLIYNGILFIINVAYGMDAFWFIVLLGALAVAVFDLIGIRNFAIRNSAEIMKYESEGSEESVVKNKKCRMCNKIYTASQNFCPGCGSSLYGEATENIIAERNEEPPEEASNIGQGTNINLNDKKAEIERLEKLFDATSDEKEKSLIAKQLYELGVMYYWRFMQKDN